MTPNAKFLCLGGPRSLRPALALPFFLVASAVGAAELTPDQLAFFESKVRPIFANNCYGCHSVEQGKAKGGLTLDAREGWIKGGESGSAVITPGDPAKSLLITAVSYADPDLQMPPKGEKLGEQDVAILSEWVKMGAPDPRSETNAMKSKLSGLTAEARSHWAYQPLKKPPVPAVSNNGWCATPVDHFILAKLEANNMVPSPSATKETLLRRATYDLTGLPPAPQEIESFLRDSSPEAFAKVIDRLLASPHYGERWGRHWLDTARYSDTIGGERNAQRGMDYRYPYAWTYRDYVIDAFNRDTPYDRFIVEQLAADKLPEAETDKTKLAALGFLTVGERFQNVNDVINDRIDVVSKGFLGATVSCARCHDHMFDPIPTKDYYALHGVFASTVEPVEKPIVRESAPAHFADFQAKLSVLEEQNRQTYYKFTASRLNDFQDKVHGYLLALKNGVGKGRSAEAIAEVTMVMKQEKLDRDLMQVLGRRMRRDDPVFAPFKMFAELPEAEFVEAAPRIVAELGEKRRRALNPLVVAAFKDAPPPTSLPEVAETYRKLFASYAPQRKAYVEAQSKAVTPDGAVLEPAVAQLLQIPFSIEPASQLNTGKLREFLGRLPQQLARGTDFSFAKINELELTHPGAPGRAMVVADAPTPRNSRVFIRGQAQVRGDEVPRRFLEMLTPNGQPEPFKDGSGRLELARHIASPDNPLTARVMVNRVWMHHFGEGFVRTPDDLGTQSEAPSHPELVDYLASYFIEQGWSVKKLHKLIMLSRVYRESSHTNRAFEQVDPQNRLLWRANIRRLDFEALRDSLLVFSGKLDRTLGGQPVNLTEEPYSYRRSVYGYIDRGNLPELMSQFDFSDPDMPNSKRSTTLVPQQALFLMNSPMAIDVARRIVARPEIAQAGNDVDRLLRLYRVVFQRTPRAAESRLAFTFLAQEQAKQADIERQLAEEEPASKRDGRAKKRAAQKGKGPYNAAIRPIQNTGELVSRTPLTAWETYAQTLLLSNEASYVN